MALFGGAACAAGALAHGAYDLIADDDIKTLQDKHARGVDKFLAVVDLTSNVLTFVPIGATASSTIPARLYRTVLGEEARDGVGESRHNILPVQCAIGAQNGRLDVIRAPYIDLPALGPHDPYKTCSSGQIALRFGLHARTILLWRGDFNGKVRSEGIRLWGVY